MELWIRSQDKESLIPVNERIFMLDLHNGRNIEIKCGAYNILGTYKTKERALEVLNEIEERIMLLNTTNFIYDTATLVGFKNALGEDKIKGLGYPYQMPED